jgi:hypothetical protein
LQNDNSTSTIWSQNGLNVFISNASLNAGIGTTTPKNTFNVLGDTNTTANLYTLGMNITNLMSYFTNSTFYPYSNPYKFWNDTQIYNGTLTTNASSIFSYFINSTFAQYSFGANNFNGSGNFNTTLGNIAVGNGTASRPSITFQYDGDDGFYLPTSASADIFALATAGVERMRFDNLGRIGINQTSPAYTLDVQGQVNALNYTGNASQAFLSLNRVINSATTNQTMASASTAYNGTNVTLTAGSWMCAGNIQMGRTTATSTTYSARIVSGSVATPTVYGTAAVWHAASAQDLVSLTLVEIVPVTASTLISLQGSSNNTNSVIYASLPSQTLLGGNTATDLDCFKIG